MTPKPLPQPWHPPKYTAADVSAIEAVARGTASADQQKHAMRAILERFCRVYDQTYFADSEGNTLYAQGMRGVGLNLITVINNAPTILESMRRKSRPQKRGET